MGVLRIPADGTHRDSVPNTDHCVRQRNHRPGRQSLLSLPAWTLRQRAAVPRSFALPHVSDPGVFHPRPLAQQVRRLFRLRCLPAGELFRVVSSQRRQ